MITKYLEPWVLYPGLLIVILVFIGVRLVVAGIHSGGRRGLSAEHLIMSVGRGWSGGGGSRSEGRSSNSARKTGGLLLILTIMLYAASTEVGARRTLGVLERRVPSEVTGSAGQRSGNEAPAPLHEADAIVVLGGGLVTDVPAAQGRAALSVEAEARVAHAAILARQYPDLPVVVSGGRVFDEPSVPPEAAIAAQTLVRMGIPSERIVQETSSRTTWENATLTRRMVEIDRPIVVTSAYHMARAVIAFKAAGMEPIAAPCAYRLDRRPLKPYMYLPSNAMLYNTGIWWRELVGRGWYRLRAVRARRTE
jgi:uncharacterized SAM-binding protein YcdF (DUF218 family)